MITYIGFLILNIIITFFFILWVHSNNWKEKETDEWKTYSLPRYVYLLFGILCFVPFCFAFNIVIGFIFVSEDNYRYYLKPKRYFQKIKDFFTARL